MPESSEGVTRHEFDASINPLKENVRDIKRDVEKLETLVSTAVGQWHQSNRLLDEERRKASELFYAEISRLDRKIIFAQGAIAGVAFLVGSGAFITFIYILIQYT